MDAVTTARLGAWTQPLGSCFEETVMEADGTIVDTTGKDKDEGVGIEAVI